MVIFAQVLVETASDVARDEDSDPVTEAGNDEDTVGPKYGTRSPFESVK